MLGASRTSLAGLEEYLGSLYQDQSARADFVGAGRGCLDVADLLDTDPTLRSALADAARSADSKRALSRQLFAGRIPELALSVLDQVFGARWGTPSDMVDAVEDAGRTLLLMNAEAEDRAATVEEEIFRFGRAIDGNPPLQMALTDPANTAAQKVGIVTTLLDGRTAPETPVLLGHLVAHLRGRRVQSAIAALSHLAASRHGRVVAEVRAARELTAGQSARLAAALATLHGIRVELNVVVDPSVIGGIEVQIGDDVVDGTVVGKLMQARRHMGVRHT